MATFDRYSQNLMLSSKLFEMEKNYWFNQLRDNPEISSFPYDYPGFKASQYSPGVINFKFPPEISQKIMVIGNNSEYSIFIILLSSVVFILSKYTNRKDILVGIPPVHKEINSESAFNSVVLPIKHSIDKNLNYRNLLSGIRQLVLESDEYKNIPYSIIQELLGIQNNLNSSTLFNTVVWLNNIHDADLLNDIRTDTKFSFVLDNKDIELQLEYNQNLYRIQTLEQIIQYCNDFLKIVFTNPDVQLGEIDLLSPIEQRKLLVDFNNTEVEYPKNKTIQDLFEEQVEKTPDSIAVVFEDRQMTYRELDQKANSLAMVLREKGIKPDDIVTIMAKRSFEMIVGIFGILKSGGAYLPIDPEYPRDRIEYLIADSGTKVLLIQNYQFEIPGFGQEFSNLNIINLEDQSLYTNRNLKPAKINKPADLAYVIYTSGSTGKPKGTMIEHTSVTNRLHWMKNEYQIDETDIILQKTSYTFDVSVWELLIWSFVGARVCLLKPGGEKDPKTIIETVAKSGITIMHFVPSMMNVFLEYLEGKPDLDQLKSLKQIFASGEALSVLQVYRFHNLIGEKFGITLHNLYGPTEATIDVSFFNCSQSHEFEIIPIGKPIDNIKLYILDQNSKLQPVGIPGELYIAGVGLARGYLNRLELTGEKFVVNPFVPGTQMYRTGDLARWLPDGNIDFLGRMDFQVKVRGFRIELGEIEYQLLLHNGIKEVAVVDNKEPDGNVYLIAYLVSDQEISISEIRQYLAQQLPDYMIPSYFIQLNKMPLTSGGKLDRKALPKLSINIIKDTEYVAPDGETEVKLAKIWQEVLGIKKVGVNDHFFAIGGTSLKLIQANKQIENLYPGKISLPDLFSYPTILKLAQFINRKELTETQIQIATTLFPDEFFVNEEDDYDDSVLEFRINPDQLAKLKNIALEYDVELYDILISLFSYILGEVTAGSEITVLLVVDDQRVFPLCMEIKNDGDLSTYIKLVHQKLKAITAENTYLIESIRKIGLHKEHGAVAPFFVKKEQIHNNLSKIGDIIFEVNEIAGLSFNCDYNAAMLRGSKMEELISKYMELILVLTNSSPL